MNVTFYYTYATLITSISCSVLFVSVANSSGTFQQTLSTIFNNVNHIRPSISYNGFLHSSCLRTSIFSAAWLPAWNVLCFTLGILFAFSPKLNDQVCKCLVFLFLYLFSNFAGAYIPVISSDCKNDNNSNSIVVVAVNMHALWVIPNALAALHVRYVR